MMVMMPMTAIQGFKVPVALGNQDGGKVFWRMRRSAMAMTVMNVL